MCEPTTITAIISGLATAAGTAVSYSQSQKAQNAQEQAAAAEMARQRRIQQTQSNLIAKQEEAKAKGRKEFELLQPELGAGKTQEAQEAAAVDRNATYQQAIAPATGADPTAAASADSAVVSDTPLAVRAAYDKAGSEGKAFSEQQATARAFLDALNDAQRQAGVTLSRGAERIGMYGDFVSGQNRPLAAWEAVKNNQSAFQAASTAAAQQGADGIALGNTIGQLGQLGYAYATRPRQGYYGGAGSGQNLPAHRTASQRPIT